MDVVHVAAVQAGALQRARRREVKTRAVAAGPCDVVGVVALPPAGDLDAQRLLLPAGEQDRAGGLAQAEPGAVLVEGPAGAVVQRQQAAETAQDELAQRVRADDENAFRLAPADPAARERQRAEPARAGARHRGGRPPRAEVGREAARETVGVAQAGAPADHAGEVALRGGQHERDVPGVGAGFRQRLARRRTRQMKRQLGLRAGVRQHLRGDLPGHRREAVHCRQAAPRHERGLPLKDRRRQALAAGTEGADGPATGDEDAGAHALLNSTPSSHFS